VRLLPRNARAACCWFFAPVPPLSGAFWFSFAGFELPHRADPRRDLDLDSYGIVKLLDGRTPDGEFARAYPGMPWEPKEAFYALAESYSGAAHR
jgi:hypothetical protein